MEEEQRETDRQTEENYPKLGGFDFQSKLAVQYLPEWIESATSIPRDIQNHKASLNIFDHLLSDILLDRLRSSEITHLFPVQSLVIPDLLSSLTGSLPPRDICVSAPTGSGKTLAYVLPILEILRRTDRTGSRRVRALVVAPVVDLARQVYQVFTSFLNDKLPLKIVLLTGQQDLDIDIGKLYELEEGRMVAKADLVIATPGRLMEHIVESGGAFSLKHLRFLIVDEADRLLSDYRIDWLKAVEKAVYDDGEESKEKMRWFFGEKRITGEADPFIRRYRPNIGSLNALFAAGRFPLQKVFLSATLSYDPGQLQRLNLFRPKLFQTRGDEGDKNDALGSEVVLPSDLNEYYITCSSNSKPLVVYQLLNEHASDWECVLCFVQSRQSSRRLAFILERLGIEKVKEASAALTRIRREKLLKKLSTGTIRVLICSDLLARGIDVPRVDCVINYDPPKQILAYVHRAGRTARAGRKGSVVTVVSDKEINDFKQIMESANRWSVISQLEASESNMKEMKGTYREALSQLKNEVQVQKRTRGKRNHARKPGMKRPKLVE